MNKHSENTKPDTCDNNVLANRILKFRVYYELDNEVRFWHVEFKQEEKRLSIPQVSTNGKILGVSQFTGSVDKNGNDIYENDIVRLSDGFFPRDREIIFDYYGSWYIGNLGISFGQMKANGFVDCEIIGNKYFNPDYL